MANTTTSPTASPPPQLPPYYNNGALPSYMDTMYWQVTAMYQWAIQSICFDGPVVNVPPQNYLEFILSFGIPPNQMGDLVQGVEYCIDHGIKSVPWTNCTSICSNLGLGTNECPINLLGCCDCPYFSFKFTPGDETFQFTSTSTGWGIFPGAINLALWCLLTLMLPCLGWLTCVRKQKTDAHVVAVPRELKARNNESNASPGAGTGGDESQLMIEDALSIFPKKTYLDETEAAEAVGVKVTPKYLIPLKVFTESLMRFVAIVGSIAFAWWALIYLVFMGGLGHQNYFAWTGSTVGIFIHVIFGAIWLIAGALNFTEALRHRYPAFHRLTGWIYAISLVISVIGLFILLFSQHGSGITGLISGWTYSLLWLFTLYLAMLRAIQRNIYEHRIWMTRNFFLGCSVIFQRIFNVLSDYIFKSGPDYFMGPLYITLCAAPFTQAIVIAPGQNLTTLTPDQVTMGCLGANSLYGSGVSASQFWWIFVWVGFIGCEVWLYIRFRDGYFAPIVNQFYKGSENEYDVIVSSMLPKTNVHVLRHANKLSVSLISRERDGNAVRLRFALPHPQMAIHIPPGHYVNVTVPGVDRPRAFTPIYEMEQGFITFLVKKVNKGEASTVLCDSLELGSHVEITGPFGHSLVYAPATYSNVVLVGGSTGVAPLMTIVESALNDPLDSTSFHFILSAQKEEDICSRFFLENLAATHPKRMDLSFVLTRPTNETEWTSTSKKRHGIGHFVGRLNSKDVLAQIIDEKKYEPSSDDSMIFVCGNPYFNLEVAKAALAVGYNRGRVFAIGTDDR